MSYLSLPILVFLGPPGSGKSYAAKRMVDRYYDHGRFVVAHDNTGEWSRHAHLCLDTAQFERLGWRELPHNSVIVLDEASRVLTHRHKAGDIGYDLCTEGRHRGYVIVICTQRAADVHRVATAHATRIQTFRVHEPRDLAYLAERGFDRDQVKRLAQYRSLTWTPQRGVR